MSTVAQALQKAFQCQKANDLDRASFIYQQVLAVQPGNPDALHGLSMVAQQKGDYSTAENLLNSILQRQPSSFKAWFGLGNVRQIQGHLPEAVAAYQQALELRPQAFPIYNNLGYVLQLQGKVGEAIDCYQQALQIQPHLPEAEVNLANALYSQHQLSPEEQIHFAALNYDLGIKRHQAGDYQTAATYYQQAIEMNPQLAAAHYNLGRVLQARGDLVNAKAAYQKVLELTSEINEILELRVSQKLQQLEQSKEGESKGKKLKIAFICQPFVMTVFPRPADSIGILTYELVKRLGTDCEITVYVPGERLAEKIHDEVCYRYIPIKLDRGILQKLAKIKGLNISATKPAFASNFYYLGYILQIGNDLKKNHHDVVHIHNLSQFAPIIRAFNPDIKIVLHMHCEWLDRLKPKIVAQRLRSVDCIISPSQYITNQVKQRFPAVRERCLTIHNGVDANRYLDFRDNISQAQPSWERSIKQLLFVGRICPEKGSHILLEALSKVLEQEPNVQLTMIGAIGVIPFEYLVGLSNDEKVSAVAAFHKDNAWNRYLSQSMAKFEGFHQDGNKPVNLTGIVMPSELPQFYQQADLFIFPSICHEAFGMPIAEAMLSGLPVIATRAGAIPELVEHGTTGLLVERGEVDALAEAILKLLGDRELRQQMGKAGQRRAVRYFTFDKVASDLLDRYQNLCEKENTVSTFSLQVAKT